MLISDSFDPGPLIENIDKYTILEDAVLEDVSPGTARVSFRGLQARAVAIKVTGIDSSSVDFSEVHPIPALGEAAMLLKGNPWSAMATTWWHPSMPQRKHGKRP